MVKIFIGNVHDSARGEDLRELFQKYGRVTESDVVEGKRFAFVHMETQDQADAAVAGLNGTELKGRSINVELATGRAKPRRFSGDTDRGGGGRRGGGRPPPGRGRGGRDFYGAPRGYGPPSDPPRGRYGDAYGGGGGRYPPDPYDRSDYYARAPQTAPYPSPRDRYDSAGRTGGMMAPSARAGAGYDPYDRRPTASGGMDLSREPVYPPRGADPYTRDPYAARRMSPPPHARGVGYYDRRPASPPASGYGGGGYTSSGPTRPLSPPRGVPSRTRYGDIYEQQRRAPPPYRRTPPPQRGRYGGDSRY